MVLINGQNVRAALYHEQRAMAADGQSSVRVLNLADKPLEGVKDAVALSKELQKLMLKLKGQFLNEDGSGVHYEAIKTSNLFQDYKKQAQLLTAIDLSAMKEDERKAFFINIYNTLTIHGLVEQDQLPSSVLQIQQFWKNTAYKIAGLVFSLDDIEHGILRCNQPHPASKDSPFPADDPRIKFVLAKLDPRIHFALVCGAKSCPAINVYSAANLNTALDSAAKNFCEQEVFVNIKLKEIRVSKLFEWYQCDFGKNDLEAVRWAVSYLSEDKAYGIEVLLDELVEYGGVDLKYTEYNWKLNKL